MDIHSKPQMQQLEKIRGQFKDPPAMSDYAGRSAN